ncbi:MAG: hypothetical protein KF910_02015 [Brevundimonas sp.]|uniref:hypothetical protein n=1 Tax=Brevundimonas sp. TaxID=1871086 RepID=UPI0025B97128|nr:hypothetical protein [Brevundimonas sp.]MBX3476359.1 hypothetical protein [Brevundimonas sp.]
MKRLAVAAMALLLGSCTAAAPAPGAPAGASARRPTNLNLGLCFRPSEYNNYNIGDLRTIYISTRRGYVYRLITEEDCFKPETDRISLARQRLGERDVCIGDMIQISTSGWRGGAAGSCLALVSGLTRDSRESGLWSRQD